MHLIIITSLLFSIVTSYGQDLIGNKTISRISKSNQLWTLDKSHLTKIKKIEWNIFNHFFGNYSKSAYSILPVGQDLMTFIDFKKLNNGEYSQNINNFNLISAVGSMGAFPCINIALISLSGKKVALGHFQPSNDASLAIPILTNKFLPNDFPLKVVLASADPSIYLLHDAIKEIMKIKFSEIIYYQGHSLIVDYQGKIYSNNFYSSDRYDDFFKGINWPWDQGQIWEGFINIPENN